MRDFLDGGMNPPEVLFSGDGGYKEKEKPDEEERYWDDFMTSDPHESEKNYRNQEAPDQEEKLPQYDNGYARKYPHLGGPGNEGETAEEEGELVLGALGKILVHLITKFLQQIEDEDETENVNKALIEASSNLEGEYPKAVNMIAHHETPEGTDNPDGGYPQPTWPKGKAPESDTGDLSSPLEWEENVNFRN